MRNSVGKTFFLLLFVFTLLVKTSRGQVERDVSAHHDFENNQIRERTFSYKQSNFRNFTVYLSFLDDIFSHLNSNHDVTEKCRFETSLLLEKASSGDTNALKFLDSAGKPSSGILEGGVFFIGFYSECVTSVVNISHATKISGQYCLINLNFSASDQENLPHASWQVVAQTKKPPTVSICIPLSCSVSDLSIATSLSLGDNFEGAHGNISTCHVNPSGFSQDIGAIVILAVLLVVFLIAVVATITDVIQESKNCKTDVSGTIAISIKSISRQTLCEAVEPKPPKKNIPLECLLAFSFKRNAKKIFTVGGGGENIPSVHGLKFLSMALIILGHTFSFATQNLFFRNPGAAGQAPKDFLSQIFANGTLAVDTFYFISGLLIAFVTLKELEKKEKKFSYLKFCFHRYFRLTPLMMIVVLISAYLIRYLGSGPNWMSSIMMYDEWCRKNAFINAFYLHNFIDTEHMCLSHSWYLATDMQFYIVVPAILIPLYKNIKFGAIVAFIFLLATTVITAVLTVMNHYPAIPYVNDAVPLNIVNSYYKNVYIKPYCRMGPYIIGIFVGYLFLHKKELVLRKVVNFVLWLVSIALGLTIIYLMWPANLGHLPTDSEAAAYSSLARTFWGVSIGWLVIACQYGYGGFVNSILSWTPLVPLSRLTYCAYLIHPVVMNIYYGSVQTIVDYSLGYTIYLFLGNISITFAISVLLCLMFESPFIALEKVIFSRKSS